MDFALIMHIIISSSVIASLMTILIFIIKWIFKKRISAKWHYFIWFMLILRLAVPYVAYSPFNMLDIYRAVTIENTSFSRAEQQDSLNKSVSGDVKNSDHSKSQSTLNINNDTKGNGKSINTLKKGDPISDFFKKLNNIKINYQMLFYIWIFGIIILSLYGFLYNFFFWTKVKNGTVFTDQSIIKLLEECKEKLGVRTNISIAQTSGISIPAIFGVTRPWLLMPEKVLKTLEHERIRYVILHELAHLKRKDIIVNWVAFILQIVHWFNPFIWYAFYKMRMDRELACDADVLMHLEQGEEKKYGHTILDMVEIISGRINYAGIAGILEDKSHIKDRITMISGYNFRKNKFSMLTAIIVVFLGSSILVNASDFTSNTAGNTNKSILTSSSSNTPTSIPTSISTSMPASMPTSTPDNSKGNSANSIKNGTQSNTSTISKSSAANNTEIETGSNAGKDKETNKNSTKETATGDKQRQEESNTQIEGPVKEADADTMEEPIDISTVFPFFRGTITKVNSPLKYVDPNRNDVHINWIKPDKDLLEKVETYFQIEVEYSLVSQDGAYLSIHFNNSETIPQAQMENSRWEVHKGTGKYLFNIPITPKRWSDGTPFQVSAQLHNYESSDPAKHNATIYNTFPMSLKLK